VPVPYSPNSKRVNEIRVYPAWPVDAGTIQGSSDYFVSLAVPEGWDRTCN
jgi:hypothetical protein